jgi:hypothetical protein
MDEFSSNVIRLCKSKFLHGPTIQRATCKIRKWPLDGNGQTHSWCSRDPGSSLFFLSLESKICFICSIVFLYNFYTLFEVFILLEAVKPMFYKIILFEIERIFVPLDHRRPSYIFSILIIFYLREENYNFKKLPDKWSK